MSPLHQPTSQTRLRPFKPSQFGRYTLLMPLAVGGMGEIFLARLEGVQGFEKLCVIKKILPHLTQEEDFVTRFVNEAKTLVQLQHGSIAQVLDMGLHEGEPYLALEFVDGKDLRKIAGRARERNIPLPLTFVLYTMGRVLDALAYAHRKRDDDEKEIGLVHRDVSPQNILISYEGEVKVIDFGLAKSTLNVAKTNPSIVMGKFLYMSPEQARHAKVDRRTDLYSVGLCLYELVAGKNPFDDVHPGELMAKVANPTITPIQQVEPLCPGPIAALVMKALAVDPAQRFQTAEEFRGKLAATLVDIDAAAGPESCSRFMREAFVVEYNSERKLLASLRDQRLGVPQGPPPKSPEKEPEPLGGGKKESSTAVRNLSDLARRSMEMPPGSAPTPGPTDPRTLRSSQADGTPTAFGRSLEGQAPPPSASRGLSFAPTPRLKEDDGRAAAVDRETMPGIVLSPAPAGRQLDEKGEPITSQAAVTVSDESSPDEPAAVVGGKLLEPSPGRRAPWPANETTLPAGPRFDASRGESPTSLPAVMTFEPSEVIEPVRQPMEGRRATLAAHSVMGPLPQALKNKEPPPERSEATGKTTAVKTGLLWVAIPLVAVLGVAGYVAYTTYEEQIQAGLDDIERKQNKLGQPTNTDTRSREVAPAPPTPEFGEPTELLDAAIAAPEAAVRTEPPKPPPAPTPDVDLAPLNKREPTAPARPLAPKKRPRPR